MIAHRDPVSIDRNVSQAIDYEAELGVIIGKGGRGIKPSDALDHVWGYTIINDVTARDLQGLYSQWLIGKSQDTFCPMGPGPSPRTRSISPTPTSNAGSTANCARTRTRSISF